MKILIFFVVFCSFFAMSMRPVEALYCGSESTEVMGRVKKIESSNITLEQIYDIRYIDVYNAQTYRYDIDKYAQMAETYIKSANKKDKVHTIQISSQARSLLNPQIGDIMADGSPQKPCSSGFYVLYGNEGDMKSALITTYDKFFYKQHTLDVNIGQELKCDSLNCDVSVNFKLDNEDFTLDPQQTHQTGNDDIKSIALLYSKAPKKDSPSSHLYGLGYDNEIIVSFTDHIRWLNPWYRIQYWLMDYAQELLLKIYNQANPQAKDLSIDGEY